MNEDEKVNLQSQLDFTRMQRDANANECVRLAAEFRRVTTEYESLRKKLADLEAKFQEDLKKAENQPEVIPPPRSNGHAEIQKVL